jgi:phosphoenolpyruvate synthase/pyruvate phosphate dikinase
MITKLSKQFDIPVESLNWYREEEILSLFDGKFVLETLINDRKQSYAFYIDKNNRRILYTGVYAKQLDSEFTVEADTKTKKIKGIVAHGSGRKVQGVVKIIRRDYSNPKVARDCMDAMKRGDILVSETTDPELMDGLKKAGAIITDVGGMLSHAAITARELDTPCIIGTEIASKILKDGDMVEVDTISSVVRILK